MPRGLTCLLSWAHQADTFICNSKCNAWEPTSTASGKTAGADDRKDCKKSLNRSPLSLQSREVTPSQLHIPSWMLGEILTPGQGSAPQAQPAVRHSWPGVLLPPCRVNSAASQQPEPRLSCPWPCEKAGVVPAIAWPMQCGAAVLCFVLTAAVDGCPGGTGTVPSSQELFPCLRGMAVLVWIFYQSAVSQ